MATTPTPPWPSIQAVVNDGTLDYVGARRPVVDFLDRHKDAAALLEKLLRLAKGVEPPIVPRADQLLQHDLILTRRELENAQRVLVNRGFVRIQSFKRGERSDRWGVTHYILDLPAIETAWQSFLAARQGRLSEMTTDAPERLSEVTTDAPADPQRLSEMTTETGSNGPESGDRLSEVTTRLINVSIPNGIDSEPPAATRLPPAPVPADEPLADEQPSLLPADPSTKTKGKAKTERQQSLTWTVAEALAEVTGLDFGVKRGQLLTTAKNLLKGTTPATPELVREKYRMGGWYHQESGDFRAWTRGPRRTMQHPSLAAIGDTWGKWACSPAAPQTGESYAGRNTSNGMGGLDPTILQVQRDALAKRQAAGRQLTANGVPVLHDPGAAGSRAL